MNHSTIANRWNADLIDEKYEIWRTGPENLDEEWRAFFEGFTLASDEHYNQSDIDSATPNSSHSDATRQARVIGLIYAYRSIGHTIAAFNPLTKDAPTNPRLTLERLGFE